MNLKSVLKKNDIYPLFGELLKGDPYVFDFSSKNPKTLSYFNFSCHVCDFNDETQKGNYGGYF